jgi:predicted DsbA family dithiol-disulfide isomerase
LQQEYDVQVEWRPFELHPETPLSGIKRQAPSSPGFERMLANLQRMARDAGLPYNSPPVQSNSRRALEAAEYAREHTMFDAFHLVLFQAYFQHGQDIGDWAVLVAAAKEAGLNGVAMRRAVEQGVYRETVEAHIGEAQRLGITAVPTFILDGLTVVGAQPYALFRQTMARLGATMRTAHDSA